MINMTTFRCALPAHQAEVIIDECIRLLAAPQPPARKDVADVCRAYYSIVGNEAGGALHIVLDDGNIEDHYLGWCADVALKIEDIDDRRPVDPAGWLLARVLLRMTEDAREDVCDAMHGGVLADE